MHCARKRHAYESWFWEIFLTRVPNQYTIERDCHGIENLASYHVLGDQIFHDNTQEHDLIQHTPECARGKRVETYSHGVITEMSRIVKSAIQFRAPRCLEKPTTMVGHSAEEISQRQTRNLVEIARTTTILIGAFYKSIESMLLLSQIYWNLCILRWLTKVWNRARYAKPTRVGHFKVTFCMYQA